MATKSNVQVNGKDYYRITRTIGKKSDGTPIKKQFYGTGKADAEEKANKFINDIKNGFSEDYDKLDINGLVETWLYNIKAKDSDFKPASFAKYEGIYRNYIKDSDIGFILVFNCKTINIQKYYNKLSKKGKTESQINNLNKVLKGAFDYAIQEGYALKNPCAYTSIPKQEKNDFDETSDENNIEIFNNDEIDKIIDLCYKQIDNGNTDYLYYMILLELGSGLRQGELLGLQNQNIDDTIRVKKSLNKVKKFKDKKFDSYEFKLITPKTTNSIRTIDLPEHIIKLISNFKDIQKTKWKQNNLQFKEDSLLFTTSTCNIIDGTNLLKRWKSFLANNNIRYLKWHSLRHSYASLLFQNGADIKTVQELLGHADINTTSQIYVHVFPETKKKAVELIDSLFERKCE